MNNVKIDDVAPPSPPKPSAGKGNGLPEPSLNGKNVVNAVSPESAAFAAKPNVKAEDSSGANNAKEPASQRQQVKEAVAKLNDYIQTVQRDLEFNLDEDSGEVVVKIVNRDTNEMIRQIPDETALKLARDLHTDDSISLLSTKA